MSQNGEGSSSSATRPTASSHEPSELSEEQKQTIEKCTNIVQEFRTGAISNPKASWILQRAIPHEGINEDQFLSSYEPYFNMLDNFERYQTSNVGRIEDIHQQLVSPHGGEPAGVDNRSDPGDVAGPIKRPLSPQSEGAEDEYAKKTRLDYNLLPWNEPEDMDFSPAGLSPALQETHTLLENFSRDPKRAQSSLLNCNRPIPQFPPSEWLNLLSGNAIDLNNVLSNVYSLSHSTSDVVKLGKDLELLHGSSAPAKTVKTHGDWVIAWDSLVKATLFVFKHRKSELLSYRKHIQRYFSSLPPQFHSRVINYDRAAHIRTAQCRAIELSDYALFTDLQIQWITNFPIAAGPSQTTEPAKEPKESTGKVKKGRRNAACRRWNESQCPNAAATCNYLHVCSKCSNPGHVASNCDAPGKK